jgi:hypothetical protein
LTIDNQSQADLSILNITFSLESWDQQIYNYNISQEPMIGPPGMSFGVRTGGNSMSITEVNLTPSGDLIYPENRFESIDYVTVAIYIRDVYTGQFMPVNPFSFYPWELGVDR